MKPLVRHVRRLCGHVSPGEPPLLPILNRYRPWGSTRGVDFPTTRAISPVSKSHINLVVLDSTWEGEAARLLDSSDLVKCFARNDHLGLSIPYEHLGQEHCYEPDFLVRLINELNLLLEIKGYEVHDAERVQTKHNAARKWVTAVNNLREFGTWGFLVCRVMDELLPNIAALANGDSVPAALRAAAVGQRESRLVAGRLFE